MYPPSTAQGTLSCLCIPEDTQHVAKAAIRQGNRAMQMRDELGTLFTGEQFADLFPNFCRPAEIPWRLALMTVLQLAENLTNRRAADAVRGRIDWTYALSLELTDAGFDVSVLTEFWSRSVSSGAEARLCQIMLTQFEARGLLKSRGNQRLNRAGNPVKMKQRHERVQLNRRIRLRWIERIPVCQPPFQPPCGSG